MHFPFDLTSVVYIRNLRDTMIECGSVHACLAIYNYTCIHSHRWKA